jgi:trehalose 6-phosphate phosphatase
VTAAEATAALGPLRERPSESAVLCDLDGVLAPIVERPEASRLAPGAREVLERLRARMRLIGFVSGRALADLERIVALPGAAYAGNHGMELRLPGGPPRLAREVERAGPAVAAFAASWPESRLAPHGVWLEDKGPTLAFHFRTAPDPDAAERFLHEAVAPEARLAGLAVTEGKRIVEVRAPVAIDKGTAVRALLAGSGVRRAAYLGDDRTDVDAWRALSELRRERALETSVAVAVVGPETPEVVREAADVEVEGTAGALTLLRLLAA